MNTVVHLILFRLVTVATSRIRLGTILKDGTDQVQLLSHQDLTATQSKWMDLVALPAETEDTSESLCQYLQLSLTTSHHMVYHPFLLII